MIKDYILCHMKDIITIAGITSIFIEISPIKVNPIRWLIRKFGKMANEEILEKVESIDSDFTNHKLEGQRCEILDFCNSCMNGRKHTREEFEHIIQVHDSYLELIQRKNLKNGQIDLAFEYIKKINMECMENNSYLKGKY